MEHTRFYANSQNTVAQFNTFSLVYTFHQVIKNSIQKTVGVVFYGITFDLGMQILHIFEFWSASWQGQIQKCAESA